MTPPSQSISLKSYTAVRVDGTSDWSPVDSDTPNFHVPEPFGILIFG